MADQEKIWFVYLTDHHEGPFTAAEVAEKAQQGLVNGQTLAWKDGMAEWLAVDSIPDLASALQAPAAGDLAVESSLGTPALEGTGSLAAMLANQQKENSDSAIVSAAPGGSALSELFSAPAAGAAASDESEPQPGDQVWTLRIGSQVTGLHSLDHLKQLAGAGDIPPESQFWRVGWSDFKSLSAVPAVASARRAKAPGATRTNISAGGGVAGRKGITSITAAANVGNDEATDPAINAPKPSFFSKLFRKKAKPQQKTGAVAIGKKKAGSGIGTTVKKIAGLVLVLGVLGGGAAAYFLFFASPIPSDLDVIPDDKENMVQVVKLAEKKFVLGMARGTEDNPADDTNPKIYLATGMPEGTKVTLAVSGKPGTLVNKKFFEKTLTATVAKTHIATFELQDEGKPIPMGEYVLKASAEGAQTLEADKFLGGKKGAAYDRRLKQYREKVEKEYNEEVEELRELVATLKNLYTDMDRHIGDFKAAWSAPNNRAKITADWRTFTNGMETMAAQLEQKVKAKLDSDQRYYARAYQDISSTLTQLRGAAIAHGQRLAGTAPATNPDLLSTSVSTSIAALEQVVAQAVVKSPFDAQPASAPAADPSASTTAPAPPAPPAASPVPAAPVTAVPAAK
jgi:hypothetical protein